MKTGTEGEDDAVLELRGRLVAEPVVLSVDMTKCTKPIGHGEEATGEESAELPHKVRNFRTWLQNFCTQRDGRGQGAAVLGFGGGGVAPLLINPAQVRLSYLIR